MRDRRAWEVPLQGRAWRKDAKGSRVKAKPVWGNRVLSKEQGERAWKSVWEGHPSPPGKYPLKLPWWAYVAAIES